MSFFGCYFVYPTLEHGKMSGLVFVGISVPIPPFKQPARNVLLCFECIL